MAGNGVQASEAPDENDDGDQGFHGCWCFSGFFFKLSIIVYPTSSSVARDVVRDIS